MNAGQGGIVAIWTLLTLATLQISRRIADSNYLGRYIKQFLFEFSQ